MKTPIIYLCSIVTLVSMCTGCGSKSSNTQQERQAEQEGYTDKAMESIRLSQLKLNKLGINIDTLPTRTLSDVVEVNGQLEVPPQHEATVTAMLGANITSINVIEGDKVRKGQILAYLSHPNLTQLQTNYVKAHSRLQYLEQEMQRQKKLYDEKVGSGKAYQQALADYQSIKGEVNGYTIQLKQLNLNVSVIQRGNIYQHVPVISPINGYIEKVNVQIGQFVDPKTELFTIINTDHIHAILMVFEKDVHKVKDGQKVSFTVESVPGKQLEAVIYSVGKRFEQNPKAIHVHAEIKGKQPFLIAGMYISGKIHTADQRVNALPEEAIAEDDGKSYIFMAKSTEKDGKTEWTFKPKEIQTGMVDNGWVAIELLEPLPEGAKVAWNKAYYLIAEMKKGMTSPGH